LLHVIILHASILEAQISSTWYLRIQLSLYRKCAISAVCSWEACRVIYRLSRKERSIFWEVTVLVILSEGVYMCICPVLNSFRDWWWAHCQKLCRIRNVKIHRLFFLLNMYNTVTSQNNAFSFEIPVHSMQKCSLYKY
jgi:hypothetical protein